MHRASPLPTQDMAVSTLLLSFGLCLLLSFSIAYLCYQKTKDKPTFKGTLKFERWTVCLKSLKCIKVIVTVSWGEGLFHASWPTKAGYTSINSEGQISEEFSHVDSRLCLSCEHRMEANAHKVDADTHPGS